MAVTHNLVECARLVTEAREDDARMPPAPWDTLPLIVRLHRDDTPRAWVSYGVARMRNNLPTIADQLEAACAEVERLRAAIVKIVRVASPWICPTCGDPKCGGDL